MYMIIFHQIRTYKYEYAPFSICIKYYISVAKFEEINIGGSLNYIFRLKKKKKSKLIKMLIIIFTYPAFVNICIATDICIITRK
jgi:hypothetical protein